MQHDFRSNDVRLLVRVKYPTVFSMESHQLTCVITIISFSFSRPPCSQSSARSRPQSSELQRSTLLRRLFNHDHSSSSAHDTSPSFPLDWARNLFKPRTQSGKGIELQGHSSVVVSVPYAKGKRVCYFSLIILLYLLSCRETLARGRNAKRYYCPCRVLLWVAHSLQSPISLNHLRNPKQLTPRCPPHLPLVMLLQLQIQQHRHAQMQRYDRLDSGLASGSLLVVSLLNIQMVIIRSSHPSQIICLWISPRTLVYADAFRTVLLAFMYDMDPKRFMISTYTVYYPYVLTVNSLRFRLTFQIQIQTWMCLY
jgi:hypothetical protein